ncbi:hypothetical protein niasHT_039914 [Heterodera trifolii]|uniref:non-specific serine/threonine protein kinase n=1 Tax=Heterodera trifolii TaxID=157864 RepID=A0ABD2IGN5_9BILA
MVASGHTLESYLKNKTKNKGEHDSIFHECVSIFKQVALSLAITEDVLAFKHRDLHTGNILVEQCPPNEEIRFLYGNQQFDVASNGVRVTIIDFTLLHLRKDERLFFDDLSRDPGLFIGKGVSCKDGDYQFNIYRMMQEARINVSAVSYEHLPFEMSPDKQIRSVPRNFLISVIRLAATPEKSDEPMLVPANQVFNELVITTNVGIISPIARTFSLLVMAKVVQGEFPGPLSEEFKKFRAKDKDAQNPLPRENKAANFTLIGIRHCRAALDSYIKTKAKNEGERDSIFHECVSIFKQVALSLAITEDVLAFEHSDLHTGNILVEQCPPNEEIRFLYRGEQIVVVSKGVRATIINFTLSRIKLQKEDAVFANEPTPSLFKGKGDYQFEVYRMMKHAVGPNSWSKFFPVTNAYWMTYVGKKLFCKCQKEEKNAFGWDWAHCSNRREFVARRKYHRGRRVPQQWVFGMFDVHAHVGVVQLVPDRTRNTLLPIIEQFVLPGTTIHSDQWAAYMGGAIPAIPVVAPYVHHSVNHAHNFVDPLTGAHTNHPTPTIDGDALKDNLRKELGQKLRVEKEEEINKTVNHFEEQIMTDFIFFFLSEQQTQIGHQSDEAALLKTVADDRTGIVDNALES